MFYFIKRRKPEILQRRALNYTNCDEGEQCGDECFYAFFQYSMVPISAIRQVLLQWVEHSSLQYYRSCQ